MRPIRRLLGLSILMVQTIRVDAQDLVPGAYSPAPVGYNVVTVLGTVNVGEVLFDPSLPAEDADATIAVAAIGLNRTLTLGGRFASVGVIVPFMHGHLTGRLDGQFHDVSRSGPADLSARIAVNLYGAPGMTRQQFATYRPTTLFGASLGVVMPTGQYNSSRAVNIGAHRWVFRPEVGVSRRYGRWTFETAVGVVFYTDNRDYLNGSTREQAPIATVQGHLIYTIRPAFWVAGDVNFWDGGRLTTDGVAAIEEQHNSRVGLTVAVPISGHQVRFAYSYGAYTRLGGDFQTLGVSYSYAWAARP